MRGWAARAGLAAGAVTGLELPEALASVGAPPSCSHRQEVTSVLLQPFYVLKDPLVCCPLHLSERNVVPTLKGGHIKGIKTIFF